MYPLASNSWDNEEVEVALQVLKSGHLTMGREVYEFERQFAEFLGSRYAVMFNSGSSANLAMLNSLRYVKDNRLSEGDQVLVPAVSWSTTFYPVFQSGLILDFVDIDLKTLNIDTQAIVERINTKTKAIFAVNLLGNPANLIELEKIAQDHNLILLEDNCESLGASINGRKTGTFGKMSSHSFFFSHHICTMEGGMVATSSKLHMETLVSLRSHGWTRELEKNNSVYPKSNNEWEDLYRFVLPGYNLRPLEISGAIGKVQLNKFPKFLEIRRKNAEYFTKLFSDSSNFLIQNENDKSSWFAFSIVLVNKLIGKRDLLIRYLSANGIETRPIVAGNFTLNPVLTHLKYVPINSLRNSNFIHENGFYLGNHILDVQEDLKNIFKLLTIFEEANLK